jgi:hypothetical protein
MILERVAAVYTAIFGFPRCSQKQYDKCRVLGQEWLQLVCFTNTQELSRHVPQSLLTMGQTDFVESNVQNPAVMIYLFSPEQPILRNPIAEPSPAVTPSNRSLWDHPPWGKPRDESSVSGSVLDRFILWRLLNRGFDRWDGQFPNLK